MLLAITHNVAFAKFFEPTRVIRVCDGTFTLSALYGELTADVASRTALLAAEWKAFESKDSKDFVAFVGTFCEGGARNQGNEYCRRRAARC
mmetsp:Transcript_5246/g.12014  ORF Transcript_5246/g.12014 Transcript_5246/m.12014 type:complete len:91 (-) Transcript_5246:140-412(-)